MKKLLYIANIRLPTEKAHGIQIMKMCEAFADENLAVELVVPTRHNPSFTNTDPFDYYGVKKNFQIQFLATRDPYWLIYLPQGIYIKFQTLFFLLSLFFHLRSRKDRADTIVYFRDEYLLSLGQRFFSQVVWEGHNLPRNPKYHIKAWQNCGAIIAISGGLENGLAGLGISKNKILVAPDGVDLEEFRKARSKNELRQILGLPTESRIVLYTGHLYEWKGAEILLKAARLFQSSDAPTPSFNSSPLVGEERWGEKRGGEGELFVFVGGTEADIKKFRQKTGTAGNVLLLGHKPYREIPKYLAAADVLVLPNSGKTAISRIYTSPLKLFEYMAAGRPIVASDIPSVREILDESMAVFFSPDEPRSLAENIKKVLTDKGLAEQISRNSQKKVQEYSWEQRAKRILEFITRR